MGNLSAIDVLIVDDESLARQKIQRFLNKLDPKYSVREAQNGYEALAKVREQSPDLLFLDIQMPGLSGLEVLYQLRKRSFPIIFQTAFDEFAVKAFDENACDYLLKPFSFERFTAAVDRALDHKHFANRLHGLVDEAIRGGRFLENFSVKSSHGVHVLSATDVDYLMSKDHYTCVYANGVEYLSDVTLVDLEAVLNPTKFVRAHRNALVRVASIRKLVPAPEASLHLKDGAVISVSRRCLAKVKNSLPRIL
jgi:two-component system, LytTR family, response regulator